MLIGSLARFGRCWLVLGLVAALTAQGMAFEEPAPEDKENVQSSAGDEQGTFIRVAPPGAAGPATGEPRMRIRLGDKQQAAAPQPVEAEPAKRVAAEATAQTPDQSAPAEEATGPSESDEDTQQPRAPGKVAGFNDVFPGKSTIQEVREAWGEPVETTGEGNLVRHVYEIAKFKRVTVNFADGVVKSIVVDLDGQNPARDVARRLGVYPFQPAIVPDESGRMLGFAYPERGVLFNFGQARSPANVGQIILEPISREPFLLRAEQNVKHHYAACLKDLDAAATFGVDDPHEHWLRARVLAEIGRYADASAAVEKALSAKTDQPEYLVTKARIFALSGQYGDGIEAAKKAIELAEGRPEVQAKAVLQLGDLVAASPSRDYQRALNHHMQAIELAEKLAASSNLVKRRTGLEILLDANLAVAQDIARGPYKRKSDVVPKWLGEADNLAEELITRHRGSDEYRLRVARHALAAYAGISERVDPARWADRALESGQELLDSTSDPLRRKRLEWDLGLGLYDALQVFHRQRQAEPALKYGLLSVTYLESAEEQMREVPGQAYLLGRLNFRIGSIYAIVNRDHEEAVLWFEKAIPLLRKPAPVSAAADIGSQGESFVSMAISYWQTDNREEAINLTVYGVGLIEQAVEEKILGKDALRVPYANLATMYSRMGKSDDAKKYRGMASSIKETTVR